MTAFLDNRSSKTSKEYYLSGSLGSEILYYYFVDLDGYYLDGALGSEIYYHGFLGRNGYCPCDP
jgi:hypothetical protein